jgi:hypothetical protein
VTHKIHADDTPAYADRSTQEKQYTNIQGSTPITPKERREEKQNSANTDNHVIKNVQVHGSDCVKGDGAQPPLRKRGCAPVETTLVRIGIDAQSQRPVGRSDWFEGANRFDSCRPAISSPLK